MKELTEKHEKQLIMFGILLKKERRLRKLTQVELAAMVDIDVRTIQRIEKGASNVSFIVILSLAEILNIEIEKIFGTRNKGIDDAPQAEE